MNNIHNGKILEFGKIADIKVFTELIP